MLQRFHKLKVSQKLMLIGVFFMIPDSVMLYLFITEINANIAVARLERAGNAYQRPLARLLDLVPRHRLLAREASPGDAATRRDLETVAAEIDRAFDDLAVVDARLGTDLGFTPAGLASRGRAGCDARSARQAWDRVSRRTGGSPAVGREAIDGADVRLTATLRRMIGQAGDVSNLILDPDIDSYYLMDVTLLALPQTQDRLSQVMADGTDLLRSRPGMGGDDLRVRLAIGLSDIRDDRGRIVASTGVSLTDNKQGLELGGVCAALQGRVPPALADYAAATGRFDDVVARVLDGPTASVTPAEFLSAGTAARAASFRYWSVAVDELDALLQSRVDYYRERRGLSLCVSALSLAAAVGLVGFITRSISTPLRLRAEAALLEGEAWFVRIVSNVPGMVFQSVRSADGGTRFTFVGEGSRELYGVEPDVIRADASVVDEMVLPEDLPAKRAARETSAAALTPWQCEWRIRHGRTGAVRWIGVRARPERRADGSVIWNGVVTDVTAIKTAEAAAAEAEARFARMAANLPGLVFQSLHRADGSFTIPYITAGVQDLFGLTSAVDGQALFGTVVADDLPGLVARVDQAVAGLLRFKWEGRVRHQQTGVVRWISVEARPSRQPDGTVLFDGMMIDVTARKAAEAAAEAGAALAAAEGSRFANMTENLPGMVYQFLVRPDGSRSFPYVSAGARAVFGMEPDEIRADAGAVFGQIVAEDRESVQAAIRNSMSPLWDGKWEGRVRNRQTGVVRWVSAASRSARRPDGAITWDGVVIDVTAIKDAEAAAEAANVAKSQFLANMSHEIRTPLNGVVGMVDLLQGTELTARQSRYAQVIRSSSDALLALINDILDFSKIEAGKMELEELDFDPNGTVEDVVAVLAQKAAAKGLQLVADVDAAVPARVRGDGDRLRQVLTNLVNNAIKFTATGEVVARASLVDAGGDVTLSFAVSDTGIGIPPDRLDRLFKSFSQVDASTTRKYGGTGLGLVISKQLVELMGGTIAVRSETGRGSTFSFTAVFRRAAAPVVTTGAEMGGVAAHALGVHRLLVADASPTHRRILENQLAGWGARVATTATGEATVALLRTEAAAGRPFAAALVDADLPDLNGATVATAIRAVPALASLPLILTSGMRSGVDPADAGQLGFARGLAKPIRQSALFDAVMAAVSAGRPVAAPVVAPASAPMVSAGPTRILLVEDVEINQFIVTEVLARSGYSCDAASNGREAVEAVTRRAYDLVLMDCQMPEMSGFEAAIAIRALERDRAPGDTHRARIVALTANALKGDRDQCLAAGMDDYLTKPLNPGDLIRAVEACLSAAPLERPRAA
jgi:PAS domain S-box-containing protein